MGARPRVFAFRWLRAFLLGVREYETDGMTRFADPSQTHYYVMGRLNAQKRADGANGSDGTWSWVKL